MRFRNESYIHIIFFYNDLKHLHFWWFHLRSIRRIDREDNVFVATGTDKFINIWCE